MGRGTEKLVAQSGNGHPEGVPQKCDGFRAEELIAERTQLFLRLSTKEAALEALDPGTRVFSEKGITGSSRLAGESCSHLIHESGQPPSRFFARERVSGTLNDSGSQFGSNGIGVRFYAIAQTGPKIAPGVFKDGTSGSRPKWMGYHWTSTASPRFGIARISGLIQG